MLMSTGHFSILINYMLMFTGLLSVLLFTHGCPTGYATPPPPPPPHHSTGRRSRYAHGDLEFSLKLSQIAAEAKTATRFGDLTLPVRFHYASTTLPLRYYYDPTTTMKIWLRFVYADGDVAATMLRPWR